MSDSGKIAFIGLGIMGAPMAANLVKAGFEVTGYNRSPARVEQLAAAGGQGAKDIAGAVADADVVATMLPDGHPVEARPHALSLGTRSLAEATAVSRPRRRRDPAGCRPRRPSDRRWAGRRKC